MKKVVACNLHQVVKVDDELEIKAYYAGKKFNYYNAMIFIRMLILTSNYDPTWL